MNPRLVKISKRLSFVLRHDPASVGLTLDFAGWIDTEILLKALHLSREDLEQIVAENTKKRFEFSSDGQRIRASQGHTIEIDLGYGETTPPEFLYHGTSEDSLSTIFTSGLLKMNRHHVHLSADQDTARIVARRRPNPTLLSVGAFAMSQAGHRFYLSTNGVWLVDHVPVIFLRKL